MGSKNLSFPNLCWHTPRLPFSLEMDLPGQLKYLKGSGVGTTHLESRTELLSRLECLLSAISKLTPKRFIEHPPAQSQMTSCASCRKCDSSGRLISPPPKPRGVAKHFEHRSCKQRTNEKETQVKPKLETHTSCTPKRLGAKEPFAKCNGECHRTDGPRVQERQLRNIATVRRSEEIQILM